MTRSLIPPTLAVLVLAAAGGAAQVEPAPYIYIHNDRIDPAQIEAWEANAKDWVAAFGGAGVGAEMGWSAYQSGFEYAWVGSMPDFAYLDAQETRVAKLAEMLGEGKLEALEAAGTPAVVEHHNEIWKYEPELSYQPDGFSLEGMGAINVATVSVKASMSKQYRELVKEAIAALEKIDAPVNWFAYSIQFGEGSFGYVAWAKDRSALHSVPDMGAMLTEAVGEEKTQEMFGRYVHCVAGEQDRDWRVRPDLSYTGAPAMADDAATGEEG